MEHKYWNQKPSSFAETVELVENYVRTQIRQEVKNKRLCYHNLTHALAVKRRASIIFGAIKPILSQKHSAEELQRWENLTNLCAIAHDMVQLFDSSISADQPRKHLIGLSETQTANKLLQYIQNLNQELSTHHLNSAILFSDFDQLIIRDAITATICQHDPQAGQASYTFSAHSIYQPYLYKSQGKVSVVGSIIALADLGALGMDGIDHYIQDGILVFLENNPAYGKLIADDCFLVNQQQSCYDWADENQMKDKLLAMTRFMFSFAQERRSRFELEIAGFAPQARQILRDEIFLHLSPEVINKIKARLPIQEDVSLAELISFLKDSINFNLDIS